MTGRLRAWACVALASAAVAGCGGYAELPLPVRELATLTIESVDLHPGAIGTVQCRVSLPEDVEGPLHVVGPPISGGGAVAVVNWAYGPCGDEVPEGADVGSALRLCLAVESTVGLPPWGAALGLVVDARAQARRFSVVGTLEAP